MTNRYVIAVRSQINMRLLEWSRIRPLDQAQNNSHDGVKFAGDNWGPLNLRGDSDSGNNPK